MKHLIFAIALLAILSSCNVQKHMTREKVTASSQIQTREAMASLLKRDVNKESTSITEKRTTETVDTTFSVPGSTLQAHKSLAELLSEGVFQLESTSMKATMLVDSASGNITFSVIEKPRTFPHKFNRVTVTREESKKTVNETENHNTTNNLQKTANSETSSDMAVTDVKRSFPWRFMTLIAIGLGLIVYFAYRIIRKRIL
ncbi:MAG: hypothetical protein Q8M08_17430 [Bacteroidales bacterium]|nr:hypothetical protein [Bacteroidales bacterium]